MTKYRYIAINDATQSLLLLVNCLFIRDANRIKIDNISEIRPMPIPYSLSKSRFKKVYRYLNTAPESFVPSKLDPLGNKLILGENCKSSSIGLFGWLATEI